MNNPKNVPEQMADALLSTKELISAVTEYHQNGALRQYAPDHLKRELEGVIVLLALAGEKCNKALERAAHPAATHFDPLPRIIFGGASMLVRVHACSRGRVASDVSEEALRIPVRTIMNLGGLASVYVWWRVTKSK